MIPLVCSVINFYLIYRIKSKLLDEKNDEGRVNVLLDTLSLVTLPPLYFFSFVYYTDIPSITSILLTIYFSLNERYFLSSLNGFFSVIMRQTNIVWIAGILGAHIIDNMIRKIYPKLKLEESTFSQFWFALKSHFKQPRLIFELLLETFKKFYGYVLVVIAFLVFLYINGSIVGKKMHYLLKN